MELSKQTRIRIFIGVDVFFFLIEILVGYAVHSLALVADAFHMLNDVLSLCVGLWAVQVATDKSSSNEYTYGWARAELIGGLINGVFLVALCLSIFLDAIQRFVEPQEVKNPRVVLIVGAVGLAFNILGLFVFHEHGHDHGHEEEGHSHAHAHEHEHVDDLNSAENGHVHHQNSHTLEPPSHAHSHSPAQPSPTVSWQVDDNAKPSSLPRSSSRRRQSVSSNRSGKSRRRSRAKSMVDDLPIHPASLRNEIMKSARMTEAEPEESESSEDEPAVAEPSEHSPLLNKNSNRSPRKRRTHVHETSITSLDGARADHKHHRHNQPKKASAGGHGHSHADMNMRGLFLHVLGDAVGNVGVMISALIIWLSHSPFRFYADPAISLVITAIILKTAIPMCKETAKPLLQATPEHINVDDIRHDIEDLAGVRSCHHIHVWALTPSKPIATLDVELSFDFQGKNAARYMQIAREIKSCLHGHGIHSSTIQPEFYVDPKHQDSSSHKLDGTRSESSSSTVRTAIAVGEAEEAPMSGGLPPTSHSECLLDCNDGCTTGKQCCGPGSGAVTPKTGEEGKNGDKGK